MSEPHRPGPGHVAVWVALGPASVSAPSSLDQRQRRYRQARASAEQIGRRLVAEYTSCPPDRQAWQRDSRGRPLVTDPGGLQVSLSHADAVVGAALSWDAAVGVDVERLRPLTDREALARTALSDSEHQCLDRLPDDHRDAQLLRFWTRKEAVAKALGTGLATNLRAIITTSDGAIISLPDECGHNTGWSLATLTVQGTIIVSVAVRAPGVQVLSRALELDATEAEPARSAILPTSHSEGRGENGGPEAAQV